MPLCELCDLFKKPRPTRPSLRRGWQLQLEELETRCVLDATVSMANPIQQDVSEAAGVATIAVVLDEVTDHDVTVEYRTVAENAIANQDYTAVTGTVTIAAGTTLQYIQIPILDNDIADGVRSFYAQLSNPQGAQQGHDWSRVYVHNDEPTAQDDAFTTDEDTPLTFNLTDLLVNDYVPANCTPTITIVTPLSHGSLTESGNGTYFYVADDDYFGSDSVQYALNDGYTTVWATLNIIINSVNDAPYADHQIVGTQENVPTFISVLSTVRDCDSATFSVCPTRGRFHKLLA